MTTGRAVTGVFLILVGTFFSGVGWLLYQDEQADLENAVEREGVIDGTDIEKEVTRRDRDDDGIRERKTSYEPIVNYSYTYDGRNYTGDSIYPGADKSFDSWANAQSVTKRFESGEAVTVYVNSEDPSSAYLIDESDTFVYYVFMGMGGVPLLLGLMLVKQGRSGTDDDE